LLSWRRVDLPKSGPPITRQLLNFRYRSMGRSKTCRPAPTVGKHGKKVVKVSPLFALYLTRVAGPIAEWRSSKRSRRIDPPLG